MKHQVPPIATIVPRMAMSLDKVAIARFSPTLTRS